MEQKPRLAVVGPVEGNHLNRWIRPFVESYDIHVFTLHQFEIHVPGVTYHALPRPTGTRADFFLNLPKLRYLLKKFDPQLIHTHYLSSYGVLTALSAPKKIPKMITIWGSDVNISFSKPLLKKLCIWALKKFDAVNCPSRAIQQMLLGVGVPASKIYVFQYGVRTDALPARKPKETNRPWKLISFRDWAPLYRIEKVVELFSEYCRTHSDLELHLMGRAGPEEKERIMALVQASPRPDLIKVHGFLERQIQLEILSEMDFMISIPTMDGMPLSVLESCYVGHIPLLSSIPANIEWGSDIEAIFLSKLSGPEFIAAIEEAKQQALTTDIIDKRRKKVVREADFLTNMSRANKIYDYLRSRITP